MIENFVDVIDIDAMLAPLAGDQAVGIDLRTDFSPNSLYYRLRDARSEARDAERIADAVLSGEAAPPAPDWRAVCELAMTALLGISKDLEIAAWLTEALVRDEGFAGFAAGIRLMDGLVREFWNAGLYPQADEDGIVTRVAPIAGLNGEGSGGTLIQPLNKKTMFLRPSGKPVAFWEYDDSRKLKAGSGVLPFEDLDRDAITVGRATFALLWQEIRIAIAAWNSLADTLAMAAGANAPPFQDISRRLGEMLVTVAIYAPDEAAMTSASTPIAPSTGTPSGEEPTTMAAAASTPIAKKIQTREDMLGELTRIADFFRRTEPHSPLAYTLDDAVRRGRMSWPDLLAEIVPDESTRSQMLRDLGIKPANS